MMSEQKPDGGKVATSKLDADNTFVDGPSSAPRNPDLDSGLLLNLDDEKTIRPDETAPSKPLAPNLHSRYQIIRSLGSGGMGAVFLGKDTKLNRFVAIKELVQSEGADTIKTSRLLAEARSLAALDHPNIVKVWDVSDDPLNPFIVMEYVDGEDLAALLKREAPLAVEKAYEIIKQLCAGLQVAHENNIIHRDIKPSNIIFTQDGTIKLTDFGIAFQPGESQLTRTGTSFGTPGYSAPEQLEDAKQIDHRADIYALGATFYHMLTGESPHIIHLDSLPEVFGKFLKRALTTNIDQRFQSVESFNAELSKLVAEHGDQIPDALTLPSETSDSTKQAPGTTSQESLAREESPFVDVPKPLVNEIFQQLLTDQDPSREQKTVWESTLSLIGYLPSDLNKLITFVHDQNLEAIESKRESRVKQQRKQEDFKSLIKEKAEKNGEQISPEKMRELCSVGKLLLEWDTEKVKQEYDSASFRFKLEAALKRGKGRLTKSEYQNFIVNGRSIGWDAERIDRCIEAHAHLKTICGLVKNKLVDVLSRTPAPVHSDTPGINESAGQARILKSRSTGKARPDAGQEWQRFEEDRKRAEAQRRQAEEKQRLAEEAARRAEEKRRQAEEAARQLEQAKLQEAEAERKRIEQAEKLAEEKRLKAKEEARIAEKERTRADKKLRRAEHQRRGRKLMTRGAVLVGAVIGILVAWSYAGQNRAMDEGQKFVAVAVGAAVGGVTFPVVTILIRAVSRIFLVLLIIAIAMLTLLTLRYGFQGAINWILWNIQRLFNY